MISGGFYKSFWKSACLIIAVLVMTACSGKQNFTGYLFVYFTGNGVGEEQVHYAISEDGFNYRALNDNKPIIASQDISSSGGVRDPHILRSPDGKGFYMVLTDLYVPEMGWENRALVMLKSEDLVHWEHTNVNIPESYPVKYGQVKQGMGTSNHLR